MAAGVGDTVTFGISSRIANGLNDGIYGEVTGDAVDRQLADSSAHTLGQVAGIAVPGPAAVAGTFKASKLLGTSGKIFWKKGLLNSNDLLRLGWSSHKGASTFRGVFGGFNTPLGKAISSKIHPYLRHLDFDNLGIGVQAA